jgi:hypothetical protein
MVESLVGCRVGVGRVQNALRAVRLSSADSIWPQYQVLERAIMRCSLNSLIFEELVEGHFRVANMVLN